MTSFGSHSFGSNTTPATMSSPSPLAGGINFGLGSNTSQSSGGLNQPNQTSGTSSGFGSLNFGASTSSTTFNPLLVGSTTTTSNPLLGGAASTASGGFSFGAVKPSSSVAPVTSSTGLSGFSFGATPASGSSLVGNVGGFSLSTPAPTATTSTTGFGGFSFGGLTTTTTSATNYTAATATATSTAATAPFNFGGLGGSSIQVSTATSIGLGGGSAPTLGLGGAQPPVATTGDAMGIKGDGKPNKETPLPQEIFATIAAFESFKSEEKAASESNLRHSAAAFHKLGEDCQKLRQHVARLATAHAALQTRVNAIKEKIITDSEDCEMARRTHGTPAHLQGDNSAPELYFARAVQGFEVRMLACRDRIEEVEKCLAVSGQNTDNDTALRELVRRQHDGLQVAASHVYTLHSKLLQLSRHLPCPDHLRPKPMFRPDAGDLSKLDDSATKSAVPSESTVIRTCFDLPGGASRLGTFQLNMAKARALSLNPAPPPTQPLQQPQLFGSNFGMGSNFGAGANVNSGSNLSSGSTGFGLSAGNPTFGAGMLGFGAGAGTSTNFGTGSSNFSSGNNFSFNSGNTQAVSPFSSSFGQSNKLFSSDNEDARRKRRL